MSPASADPSLPVAVGEVVDGKYRVERVLGQGAMGVVVAATHLQLEQPVAIKFLVVDPDGVPLERFLREARATARLKGAHLCRVLDVTARPREPPYIVMEYLAGQDLEQLVRARGRLAITEAVDYVLQACEGLAEAHAAGRLSRRPFRAAPPLGIGPAKQDEVSLPLSCNHRLAPARPQNGVGVEAR